MAPLARFFSRCASPGRGVEGGGQRRPVVAAPGSKLDALGVERRLALAQVRLHLALDALQGVVDGLRCAADALADLLVGVAVEVERECPRLEFAELAREAADERAELSADTALVAGSSVAGPGRISSSVGSLSSALAAVRENDT